MPSGKIAGTGGWDKYKTAPLQGTVSLPKGALTLSIKPTTMPHGAVMNLREVKLTPAK